MRNALTTVGEPPPIMEMELTSHCWVIHTRWVAVDHDRNPSVSIASGCGSRVNWLVPHGRLSLASQRTLSLGASAHLMIVTVR